MSPDQGAPAGPKQDPEQYRVAPEPPPAKEQKSRWPGWIWAIPIAAVAIVGWLAVKQLLASGPAVNVTFQTAGGVSAGNTQVKYQGMKVGEVEAVHFAKDLSRVNVRLRMDANMEGHLGPGTEFWITGQNPSLTNLSSLRAIISGPSIGISPRNGKTQDHYTGLSQAPVLPGDVPGRHFVLTADQLGNVQRGSMVWFKGVAIGAVDSTKLQPDRSFTIGLFVKSPYDALVRADTRFWNAGAIQLSLQDGGPRLQMQSPMALLQGAIGMETPEGAAGPEAAENHQFTLYDSKDAAEYAPGPKAVAYRVVFDATGGGLADHATVELAGKRVGTVQQTVLEFDSATGKLREQVKLALEPSRIDLGGATGWQHPRQQMDALLNQLIGQGLRAQLGSSVPLVGAKTVELAFVAGPSDTALIPGNPPEIPSQSGGGGISGILAAVNKITGKLDSLPIDQIAENIRTITARAAKLTQSPELQQALDNLNQSAANVQHLTAVADAQGPEIIKELRAVATQAEATIKSARSLLSNRSGVTATGVQTAGLSETLYEISQAARAVRQLADYLDRHPSALIRGK